MSAYLKILPAVLLDPEVLFFLGQKICLIVRDTLTLDPRLNDICSAIEREGRTLCEVIARSSSTASDLDVAAISCEKACSLLKTGIQLNLFQNDENRIYAAQILLSTMESPEKYLKRSNYDISNDRIRDIIVNLESKPMLQALNCLNLTNFYEDLKDEYRKFEIIQIEYIEEKATDILPTLRSTVALYGMLIDTLIANVRFENYRLLHRVEPVVNRIENVISEALETTLKQNRKMESYLKKEELTI